MNCNELDIFENGFEYWDIKPLQVRVSMSQESVTFPLTIYGKRHEDIAYRSLHPDIAEVSELGDITLGPTPGVTMILAWPQDDPCDIKYLQVEVVAPPEQPAGPCQTSCESSWEGGGCGFSCEIFAETGGCESGIESGESGCMSGCESSCESEAERWLLEARFTESGLNIAYGESYTFPPGYTYDMNHSGLSLHVYVRDRKYLEYENYIPLAPDAIQMLTPVTEEDKIEIFIYKSWRYCDGQK